jgi:hypothetical protein
MEKTPQQLHVTEFNNNGSIQFKNAENGRFVSHEDALNARQQSEAMLHETLAEIGSVSQQDYSTYREQLGLPANHDHWVGNSAVFDKKSVIEEAMHKAEDIDANQAETIQHDQRQAEYNDMFTGLSDSDIERKVEAGGYHRSKVIHNETQNGLLEKRKAENSARLDYESTAEESFNNLQNAKDLDKLGISELASLLSEKPDYSLSKREYVTKVGVAKAQAKSTSVQNNSGVLPVFLPKQTASTKETIQAVKEFHSAKNTTTPVSATNDSQPVETIDELVWGDLVSAPVAGKDDVDELIIRPIDAGLGTDSSNSIGVAGPLGSLLRASRGEVLDVESVNGREKRKLPKKLIAGALAVAAVIGLVFAGNKVINDTEEISGSLATVEQDVSIPVDSGIDFDGVIEETRDIVINVSEDDEISSNDGLAVDSETDKNETETDVNDTSETYTDTDNDTEFSQETVSQFAELDPELIEVSDSALPWNNVVNAGAENPVMTVKNGLVAYNTAFDHSFSLRSDGMFWEGNRVISPSELAEFNSLMHQLAEQADELDS